MARPRTPKETVGQRLRRLRLERGLSQRQLAAPGVSYAYISRIEADAAAALGEGAAQARAQARRLAGRARDGLAAPGRRPAGAPAAEAELAAPGRGAVRPGGEPRAWPRRRSERRPAGARERRSPGLAAERAATRGRSPARRGAGGGESRPQPDPRPMLPSCARRLPRARASSPTSWRRGRSARRATLARASPPCAHSRARPPTRPPGGARVRPPRARAARRDRGGTRARVAARPVTVETAVRPRGPYVLALSCRLIGDATRTMQDGRVTAAVEGADGPELAQAWQRPDGLVVLRAASEQGLEQLRFCLALDADHTEFLRRFGRDPLIGPTTRHLPGLRPVRTATVAQALLRALCGQLILARDARAIERRIIRAVTPAVGATRLHAPPTTEALAALSAARLRRARPARPARRDAAPRLPLARPRPPALDPDGGRRGADRARARPRPVVGRHRLPRRARPPGARARARPRPGQAPVGAARRRARRGRGDGRAARAVRRVGRARERVPAGRLLARARAAPGAARGVGSARVPRDNRLRLPRPLRPRGDRGQPHVGARSGARSPTATACCASTWRASARRRSSGCR